MSDSIVLFIILLAIAFAWYVYQNETSRMVTSTVLPTSTAVAPSTTIVVTTTDVPETTTAAPDETE